MSPAFPLVAIAGPTASGKSALAIRLGLEFDGEVLACDSTQIYRGFDVGTGKVTAEERAGVPHHLMDLRNPEELFTAGDYMRAGRQALAEVSGRGKLPVITAGTGLYLRALLEGLAPLPARSEELRRRLQLGLEDRGPAYLHRLLSRVDPASAHAIAPQDGSKLVRALEICFLARKPRSEFFREGSAALEGYRVLLLGLRPERTALYQRIEARVEAMMEAGWLEETRKLLAPPPTGVRARPPGVKGSTFLGYRQLAAHIRGQLSLAEAVTRTKRETRQYAKRQLTWFRREQLEWMEGFGDDAAVEAAVLARVRRFLAGD